MAVAAPPHSSLPAALLLLTWLSHLPLHVVTGLGVNWGSITNTPMSPAIVVQLLQANNISKVKLFDANPDALTALAGTSIEVMVGIPNDFLQPLSASSVATDAWVHDNVTRYMVKGGVNIKYVAVGNEPFLTSYGGRFQKYTFPALNNIHQSLVKAGLGDQVKVTVPCNADVLQGNFPSKGQFRPDIKEAMMQIVTLLSQINAPFIVNIYPFLDLIQQSTFPIDYAFFDGTTHQVQDGAVTYTNALDASFDTTVSALGSLGFSGMQVVVGEIGWPTDGAIYANVSNAQRFNQGLLKRIMGKQGTPLRPGTIEAYIFSLLDENKKSTLPGNFERHWGIFTFDGQAKYPLDLTGQGLSTTLINAENVQYLPTRWCIANPNSNVSNMLASAAIACAAADCTALAEGGSCSNVGPPDNASYAFNSYYQLNNQEASSCFFNGLGLITFVDPSIGECRFLIGVSDSSANLLRVSIRFIAVVFTGFLISILSSL